VSKKHRLLEDMDIDLISKTYHSWKGKPNSDKYRDVVGFCKSVDLDKIASEGNILTPGRYVGFKIIEDKEPFKNKMKRLTKEYGNLSEQSKTLDTKIKENLKRVGFGSKT